MIEKEIKEFDFFKKNKKISIFEKFKIKDFFLKLTKSIVIVLSILIYFRYFYYGMTELSNIILYTSGIYIGVKTAFKMKESHPPTDFTLKDVYINMVFSAILIALPSLLQAA